ncbi:hypothetical protein CRG98_028715 [Punica granatum]|uniref:Uncharacterized protein n=1 Tax=Punica granatum TaxID=22663 RepID=A0A2I0J3T1_PUNGR|nr:hypothetical protein CRG98_028715 [Punica granatum]
MSAPHFGSPTPTKDSRPKLELLFMTRQSEANARTWEHGLQKRSKVLQKGSEGQSKWKINNEPQNSRSRHFGTIHHRITEASEDIQYGTLEIPLGTKMTNGTSERISEAFGLGQSTPEHLQTPS